MQRLLSTALLAGLATSPAAFAETVNYTAPTFDTWGYAPVNWADSSPAGHEYANAALFSKTQAVGNTADREDRAGKYFAAFDLSSTVTSGLGASNYQIQSVRFTVELAEVTGNVYLDSTYDSYRSHLVNTDANYQADADAGTPFELFGTAFGDAYSQFDFGSGVGFAESTLVGGWGQGADTPRNIYAVDFDAQGNLNEVTENVDEGFEANPWAIGTVAGKTDGDLLAIGDQLVFDIDVNDANIQAYFQDALNKGELGLALTSLHTAERGLGLLDFARIFTDSWDSQYVNGYAPQLEITYTVPEPASLALVGGGVLALASRRRRA